LVAVTAPPTTEREIKSPSPDLASLGRPPLPLYSLRAFGALAEGPSSDPGWDRGLAAVSSLCRSVESLSRSVQEQSSSSMGEIGQSSRSSGRSSGHPSGTRVSRRAGGAVVEEFSP
jgi:hypothetical protein